jgi:hypothetical protein
VLPRKVKDFELRLGKLGLTVFIVGMSLALLVVFAFGVKVGKDIDTYPGKIVGIIPGLKGKILSRPPEPLAKKGDLAESKDSFKLGFYESLKKPEGQEDLVEVKNRPAPEAVLNPQPGTKTAPAAPLPSPKPEPAKTEPPAKKVEVPKPPQVQEAAPRYFIQVAALKDEAKARALKAKLVKLGYSPQFEAIKKDNGKLYRLRLTGYASQEEASKALGKLEKQVSGTKCLVHKESK